MPWNLFKRREDCVSYIENLLSNQICWKTSCLHIGEVIIHEADNDPLLLVGFMGWIFSIQSYTPDRLARGDSNID